MPPKPGLRYRIPALPTITAIALASFTAILPLSAQELPPPGERWREVRGEGLVLRSAAAEKRTASVAQDLASFRKTLLKQLETPEHQSPYPTEILLFRRKDDLASYHRQADGSPPPEHVLSVFDRRGRLVALAADALERDLPQIRRLLAHDLISELGPVAPAGSDTALVSPTANTEPAALSTPRQLDRDELLLALGDLIARSTSWNTVGAELHYSEIQESSRLYAAALRGIATLRDIDGRSEDATEVYLQSLALEANDALTLTLAGWSRLDGFRYRVGTRRAREDPLPETAKAAYELFSRAVESSPRSPYPLHGLGASLLYGTHHLDEGLLALRSAHELLPNDYEILGDLVIFYAHSGRNTEAHELFAERLEGRGPEPLLDLVDRMLVEEDLAQVTTLVQQEHAEEAILVLRTSLEHARSEETRDLFEQVLEQLEKIREGQARDREVERFNTEVYPKLKELMDQGRLEEAQDRLEELLAQDLHPDVRARAGELLLTLQNLGP